MFIGKLKQGRIQGLSLGRAIYEGKGGLENFRRHALQSLTERGQRPFSTKKFHKKVYPLSEH